jgi:hypothetical protein
MNAMIRTEGMPKICHSLHEHVFSSNFTINLMPPPPITKMSPILFEYLITSISKFMFLSFNFLLYVVGFNLVTSCYLCSFATN